MVPLRFTRYLPYACIFCLIWVTIYQLLRAFVQAKHFGLDGLLPPPRQALIVASRKADRVSWLDLGLAEWRKYIYVMDDPKATLTVPARKGLESMVYLTYIIDHYYSLPEINAFIHADRYQWRNDDPDYDNYRLLSLMRLDHVRSQGYVNMRCTWILGCPAQLKPKSVKPHTDASDHWKPKTGLTATYDRAHQVYREQFKKLFPGTELPDVVAQACCAQFAVTADRIRKRPRRYYVNLRKWLIKTKEDDLVTGRIFEFSWHMIFGTDPVFCPLEKSCYCDLYGLCNLACNPEGKCPGRYVLTPSANMPRGWPHVGWNGEYRPLAWDTGMTT